jgi:hypothetical protein
MIMDITTILTVEYPGAQWTLDGDTYDGLTWLDDSPQPTEAELVAAWPRVQAVRANEQAQRDRAAAYAAEADPLFFKAQRGEADITEWEAAVADIRARFPYVEVPE